MLQTKEMRNSELFRFACQCLVLDEHPERVEDIRSKFHSGEADLDRFIRLCSNHLVLPVVYRKLKMTGITKDFPEEYTKHLEEIYRLNIKRNTKILQQVEEINGRLQKEGIEPLYLKGTANLLDGLYADIGDRMIGDIDFLVKEEQYMKTADLICDLGYKTDKRYYEDLGTYKHYPRLFREDVPADIEVHRLAVTDKYSVLFQPEILFQHKRKVAIVENCYVSSNEHKLIHTFIHSQLIDKGHMYKSASLRNFYDTFLLLKKTDPDFTLIAKEEKTKAKDFFGFTEFLFSINAGSKEWLKNNTNSFARKHRWFLNHPNWHRLYYIALNLYQLIIIRYLLRTFKALFQKSSFRHIYVRVKDPHWYEIHFKSIRKIFRY